MKSSDRRACADDILDLARLVQNDYPRALAAWEQFSGELASNGLDGGRGGGSDNDGGPTAKIAMRSDPFIRDRELFDAALELAHGALKEAQRLILVATVYEAQPEKLPGCKSCARAKDYKDKPIYSPVHGHNLCWWCGQWKLQYKTEPPLTLLVMHHRGIRISEQMAARYTKAG